MCSINMCGTGWCDVLASTCRCKFELRPHSLQLQVHIVGSAGLPADLKPLIAKNAKNVVFHDWLSDADLLALYGKVS